MAITHHGSPSAEAFSVALFARAVNVVAETIRSWRNRKQFRRLSDMSDWELADVGLDRADLRDAWERRVETDPTVYLNLLVRSRIGLEDAARRVA